MIEHVNTLRGLFDQVRPHIRPEADQMVGAMCVAFDQAESAAAAEPAPPSPIEAQLASISAAVGDVRAAVRALTEGAGL